jgi:hypothetical protein
MSRAVFLLRHWLSASVCEWKTVKLFAHEEDLRDGQRRSEEQQGKAQAEAGQEQARREEVSRART